MERPPPPAALAAAVPSLRCPHCARDLGISGQSLACASGHSYDIARQGNVSLLPPGGTPFAGDTAEMVSAREAFLAAGHYEPIAATVAAEARGDVVVDLGAGTGYYLATALARLPDAMGIALDASRPALRRAVRASPRIAAVACDVWSPLPVRDRAADVVLDVFAPRNGEEIARILRPGGTLIVVTPGPDHLRELVEAAGMLGVEAEKRERLHAQLAPWLEAAGSSNLEFEMRLSRDDARALVAMGPSAHHVDAARVGSGLAVTASVVVEAFRSAR